MRFCPSSAHSYLIPDSTGTAVAWEQQKQETCDHCIHRVARNDTHFVFLTSCIQSH